MKGKTLADRIFDLRMYIGIVAAVERHSHAGIWELERIFLAQPHVGPMFRFVMMPLGLAVETGQLHKKEREITLPPNLSPTPDS